MLLRHMFMFIIQKIQIFIFHLQFFKVLLKQKHMTSGQKNHVEIS
jgi:hypothetical protein